PMLFGFYISLTDFDGMSLSHASYVGLANYKEALQDSFLPHTFRLSFTYWIMSLSIGGAIALGLALLLNRKMRGQGIFRTTFYLPTMVPVVVTVLLFGNLLAKDFGFLNLLLGWIRPGTNIDFVRDHGMACMVALAVWGLGTNMVLFLAGLQGIPDELREAAAIDGANSRQIFRYVTWPLLGPVTYFVILNGTVAAFQALAPATLISQVYGGWFGWQPLESTYVNVAYIFVNMFMLNKFGYGAALTWILFLVIMVLTLIIRAFNKRLVYYEIDQGGGGN
ncbi:MAG: carbohydrate ABC transporter permease, partial [Bacillota bacterium]